MFHDVHASSLICTLLAHSNFPGFQFRIAEIITKVQQL